MDTRTTSAGGHGLSNAAIYRTAGVLITVSVVGASMLPDLLRWPNGGAQGNTSLSALTIQVLCEILSWVAAPLYAWLLVQEYRRMPTSWRPVAVLAVLAVVSEVPYDLTTTGHAVDLSSQNPIFALLIAALVLRTDVWAQSLGVAVRRTVTTVMAVAGFLWIVLFRVGLRQHVMSLGVVILGCALIFAFLRTRENTMMYTAGLLGAAMLMAPAIGVVVLHFRDDTSVPVGGTRHWLLVLWYPLLLVIAALAKLAMPIH